MGKVGNAWGESGSDIVHLDGKRRDATDIVCLEGNGSRPSHKGDGWSVGEVMYTLNSTEVHAVCYRICSYYSNAMKSSNPHSGVYQAEISNTLDNMNCGYPACNQGGVAVVEIHSTGTSPE